MSLQVDNGALIEFKNNTMDSDFVCKMYKHKFGIKLYPIIKRVFDVLLSVFALIMLSLLFLIVALLIKHEDKGRIIYSQIRVGKNGKQFKMFKFRSMCENADKKIDEIRALNERDGPAFKIKNDPRVTKIGSFIRKTCIDELPQLINVIKGDMSIVGPRPPLPDEVAQYTEYHKKRLSVIPGLTCFWQVEKHDKMTFNEWVKLDLKYIRTKSLLTDFKIIFLTMKVVLLHRGEN